MKEHLDLIRAWRSLPPQEEAILATVVATRGSVYRRPGARMLLTRDRWLAGSVSGGCVESDLLQSAFDRIADGPVVVQYDSTSPDDLLFGFGLGCQGVVDVLLQRLPEDGGALGLIEEVVQRRSGCWLQTDLTSGHTVRLETEPTGGLVERIEPPHGLVVFGAGHDAIPLVRMASDLGWHVTVVDHRASYLTPGRFPYALRVVTADDVPIESNASVVVMTHNYERDLAVLRWVRAPYIGVLGPRSRTQRLLEEAGRDRRDVHTPVGLDIGSEGPEEIALAILAEIIAFRSGRNGRPLNEREGAIHS